MWIEFNEWWYIFTIYLFKYYLFKIKIYLLTEMWKNTYVKDDITSVKYSTGQK